MLTVKVMMVKVMIMRMMHDAVVCWPPENRGSILGFMMITQKNNDQRLNLNPEWNSERITELRVILGNVAFALGAHFLCF